MLAPTTWRSCIRRGDLDETVAEMLKGASDTGGPSHCNKWGLKIEGNKFSGKARCMIGLARYTAQIEGRLSENEINATKSSRTYGLSTSFEVERTEEINGKLTGECNK